PVLSPLSLHAALPISGSEPVHNLFRQVGFVLPFGPDVGFEVLSLSHERGPAVVTFSGSFLCVVGQAGFVSVLGLTLLTAHRTGLIILSVSLGFNLVDLLGFYVDYSFVHQNLPGLE